MHITPLPPTARTQVEDFFLNITFQAQRIPKLRRTRPQKARPESLALQPPGRVPWRTHLQCAPSVYQQSTCPSPSQAPPTARRAPFHRKRTKWRTHGPKGAGVASRGAHTCARIKGTALSTIPSPPPSLFSLPVPVLGNTRMAAVEGGRAWHTPSPIPSRKSPFGRSSWPDSRSRKWIWVAGGRGNGVKGKQGRRFLVWEPSSGGNRGGQCTPHNLIPDPLCRALYEEKKQIALQYQQERMDRNLARRVSFPLLHTNLSLAPVTTLLPSPTHTSTTLACTPIHGLQPKVDPHNPKGV